ncbi:hypothetical protein V6C32_10725 [Desulforamulus ruminis]|uniref:hypothetical protein n=1 Tax=Desulforamulus ruminis TaxID=1564 RepID=UPI002FDA00C8
MVSISTSICNLCAMAVPQLCPWIAQGDRSGLEYRRKDSTQFEIIVVTGCSRFRQGPLPSLGGGEAGSDETFTERVG